MKSPPTSLSLTFPRSPFCSLPLPPFQSPFWLHRSAISHQLRFSASASLHPLRRTSRKFPISQALPFSFWACPEFVGSAAPFPAPAVSPSSLSLPSGSPAATGFDFQSHAVSHSQWWGTAQLWDALLEKTLLCCSGWSVRRLAGSGLCCSDNVVGRVWLRKRRWLFWCWFSLFSAGCSSAQVPVCHPFSLGLSLAC